MGERHLAEPGLLAAPLLAGGPAAGPPNIRPGAGQMAQRIRAVAPADGAGPVGSHPGRRRHHGGCLLYTSPSPRDSTSS
eukprot:12084394-Prorocentrum_lima.AAC.1